MNALLLSFIVRQVRSIQYQLSNLKYINDGWTVRLPSPIEFEDVSDSEEEADVLVPASIPSAAIKVWIFYFYRFHSNSVIMIL